MTDKKYADHLELEKDTPVVIKPWTIRAVKTENGTKYMLGIREGGKDLELPWLPLDAAERLVELKVCTRGTWPDGNPKYTVIKGAPDIVVCKRQPKGEKYAHLEFAIPGEDDGPDMPDSGPEAAKSPAPAGASRATPPDLVKEAVDITRRICSGLNIENLDDPLVAQAAIECAEKLYVTLRIESQR